AVLEQDERGNAHDAVAGGQFRLVVHVQLGDGRPVPDFPGQLFDDGFLHSAGAAPRRPEIHQGYALLHRFLEILLRQRRCHVYPLLFVVKFYAARVRSRTSPACLRRFFRVALPRVPPLPQRIPARQTGLRSRILSSKPPMVMPPKNASSCRSAPQNTSRITSRMLAPTTQSMSGSPLHQEGVSHPVCMARLMSASVTPDGSSPRRKPPPAPSRATTRPCRRSRLNTLRTRAGCVHTLAAISSLDSVSPGRWAI